MLQHQLSLCFCALHLQFAFSRFNTLFQSFQFHFLFDLQLVKSCIYLLDSCLQPSLLFFLLHFSHQFLDLLRLNVTTQKRYYLCCLAKFSSIFLRLRHYEDSFHFSGISSQSLLLIYSHSFLCFPLRAATIFALSWTKLEIFSSHSFSNVVNSSFRYFLTSLFSFFCLFSTSTTLLQSSSFFNFSALTLQFSARTYFPSLACCSISRLSYLNLPYNTWISGQSLMMVCVTQVINMIDYGRISNYHLGSMSNNSLYWLSIVWEDKIGMNEYDVK